MNAKDRRAARHQLPSTDGPSGSRPRRRREPITVDQVIDSALGIELRRRLSALPAETFPNTTRYADELTAGPAEERFDFTIGLMIGGLAQPWPR